MSSDTAHCEMCESTMFGGSVVGDPRYFCGVCRSCFEKAEAERDAAIVALARRTVALDRAKVALEHCTELIRAACPDSTVWTDEGGLADEVGRALADEPEED